MEWPQKTQYNCRKIGKAEQEYIKILIREDIALSIYKKRKRWIGTKSFGLLIGNKYEDENHIVVYIDHILPVGALESNKERPVLTNKKWIAIKERVLRNNPGQEIVGWYGVRAGWGGLLKEEDQWLHANFFYKSWQVIYLLDEKNSSASLYYWYQKKLKRCDGYYQFCEDAKEKKNKKFGAVRPAIQFSAAVAAVMLFFALYMEYIQPHIISYRNEDKDSVEAGVYKGEREASKLSDRGIEDLKDTISYLENRLKSKEAEIQTLRERAEQNQSETVLGNPGDAENISEEGIDNAGAGSGEDLIIHIIEKGDTLSYISEKYYGDSSYNMALGKVNRISDHKLLSIGDYLIIPPKDEIEEWK